MTYVILAIVVGWLIFDAFSEMLVNGTSFFRAFKLRWSDRIWNTLFNKTLNQYNQLIDKKGQSCSLYKQTFAYLDYDEYVTFSIFRKDKVVQLEYSITNDELKIRTINLKDLKTKDSYYGRWINGYYNSLEKAQPFNGDYKTQIDNMVILAIEEDIKSQKESEAILMRYDSSYKSSNLPYDDKISIRKQEMINLLEKELTYSQS